MFFNSFRAFGTEYEKNLLSAIQGARELLYYPSRRQSLASLRALIDFLRTNLKARTGLAERK
jgi:hypothetical protein